jgi:hypothetical protein
MINLTTCCGKSETFLAALTLIFFAAPATSFGQLEEFSQPPQRTDSGVSVLELRDIFEGTSTGLLQPPQDVPFANQPGSIPSSFTPANALQQTQQPNAFDAPLDAAQLEEPQVLLRGPLHEAFADAHQADPQPNPIVNVAPPAAIQEVPPEFKPEGNNVEWISGYWAWDESQNDFIWISGVWRDVPPNQRWVTGYWELVENGHRWIAGFWAGLEQQELSYLPTPPANLDRGPSVTAPSEDYFYCPGNWEYQNNNYVWRTGHWQPRVADWIWIPARYIWTPRGCVYRPGYWDREFDVRGTLFAPVHFQQQQYLAANFSYQPNHCVNTGADFFVHLFVRQNCNHYFYGDWYGQNFVNTGFRPWVQPQSHFRNYDPLLAHYNCSRYRQGSQLLISWVNNQHRHYHRNHSHRPRNTLQAHVNFSNSSRDHRHHDFIKRANLANRYDDIVRGRGNGKNTHPYSNRYQRNNNPNFKRNYVRTDRHDHDRHDINKRLQREIKNTRKLAEQRSRNSGRNGNRLAQDLPRPQRGNDKHSRHSHDGRKTNQVVSRNGKDPRSKINPRIKQNSNANNRGNSGKRDIARRDKVDLPKAQIPRSTTRNERGRNTQGLTRAQIEKAQRDQVKASRKRELEQKIAASKQQAEIKRRQRETAQKLKERQRQQTLAQTKLRIAQEKQSRQSKRNPKPSPSKRRIEQPHLPASATQNVQRKLDQQRRKQQLAQRQPQLSRTGFSNGRDQRAQNAKKSTTRQKTDLAKQQRELAKKQRDAQNRMAADRAKQANQQKIAQSRQAARQRDLQRQRGRAAKAQADAQKRNAQQARLAREKSQRESARRAAQQRAKQKVQADAQRRAREKSQRDAQRKSADQARRTASAAKKRQRDQEQAARRAKRKKK